MSTIKVRTILVRKTLVKSTIVTLCLLLAACAGRSERESVWIDVRSLEEYNDDHINGDLNMPLADIDVAGFSNVNNMGGIGDARKIRNLAVQTSAE